MMVSNRNLLFQWFIFRGYVSFREGIFFVKDTTRFWCIPLGTCIFWAMSSIPATAPMASSQKTTRAFFELVGSWFWWSFLVIPKNNPFVKLKKNLYIKPRAKKQKRDFTQNLVEGRKIARKTYSNVKLFVGFLMIFQTNLFDYWAPTYGKYLHIFWCRGATKNSFFWNSLFVPLRSIKNGDMGPLQVGAQIVPGKPIYV